MGNLFRCKWIMAPNRIDKIHSFSETIDSLNGKVCVVAEEAQDEAGYYFDIYHVFIQSGIGAVKFRSRLTSDFAFIEFSESSATEADYKTGCLKYTDFQFGEISLRHTTEFGIQNLMKLPGLHYENPIESLEELGPHLIQVLNKKGVSSVGDLINQTNGNAETISVADGNPFPDPTWSRYSLCYTATDTSIMMMGIPNHSGSSRLNR